MFVGLTVERILKYSAGPTSLLKNEIVLDDTLISYNDMGMRRASPAGIVAKVLTHLGNGVQSSTGVVDLKVSVPVDPLMGYVNTNFLLL